MRKDGAASRIQTVHVHSHSHDHTTHEHGAATATVWAGIRMLTCPLEGMTGILGAAVVATFVLVAAELIAGYAGHSIALISDAVHNLTDVPTLVISWLAMRWAKRPPTAEKTYGYHRGGILGSLCERHAARHPLAVFDL